MLAGVGVVVLGTALAVGYRRTELGLGPGLAVLAAGAALLLLTGGVTAERVLLAIPLGMVFFEEALFRGVLWAVLRRTVSLRVAVVWQATPTGPTAWSTPCWGRPACSGAAAAARPGVSGAADPGPAADPGGATSAVRGLGHRASGAATTPPAVGRRGSRGAGGCWAARS